MMVIVPTRERPINAADLIEAWKLTGATCRLFFAVDDNDPQMAGYDKVLHDAPDFVTWRRCPTRTMIEALNYAAMNYGAKHDIVGFMGDDHRPRTYHWDQQVRDVFREMGPRVVYGNDLIHGQALPTAVFLPGQLVAEVGHMAPPTLRHMYADNYWKTLGDVAGLITYLPDVTIQHMHPITGQVPWDAGYIRVNAGQIMSDDRIAFEEYCGAGHLTRDVARLEGIHARWSN